MMSYSYFSGFASDVFQPQMGDFRSMQGRVCCFKLLVQKIVLLPFMLLYKACVTFCRGLGLLFSLLLLIMTFGATVGSREFFLRRVVYLAKDMADWVFLPFSLVLGLFKLLLGATIHPGLYFRI